MMRKHIALILGLALFAACNHAENPYQGPKFVGDVMVDGSGALMDVDQKNLEGTFTVKQGQELTVAAGIERHLQSDTIGFGVQVSNGATYRALWQGDGNFALYNWRDGKFTYIAGAHFDPDINYHDLSMRIVPEARDNAIITFIDGRRGVFVHDNSIALQGKPLSVEIFTGSDEGLVRSVSVTTTRD